MQELKVITVDNPEELNTLRSISQPLTKEDIKSPEIQELLDQMYHRVKTDKKAGGLAAIQVGKKYRIFISEILDHNNNYKAIGNPIIFINPEIEVIDFTKVLDWEGCLSIPGKAGQVYRYNKIKIKYIDREGKPQKAKYEDYTARIIQHEFDHLDGILFTDKLTDGLLMNEKDM